MAEEENEIAFRGALMLGEQDNIAVCLEDFSAGDHVEVRFGEKTFVIEATEDIPCGFKIALDDIAPGWLILKCFRLRTPAYSGESHFPFLSRHHARPMS